MADAPKIQGTDTLRQAYPKLNSAIDNSNEALTKSNSANTKATDAVNTANAAETKADSVQTQFNQVVIDGDSSVEAAQARVSDVKGITQTFSTLKDRNDNTDLLLTKSGNEGYNIQRTYKTLYKKEQIRVVIVGDSIAAGSSASDGALDWSDIVKNEMIKRFPGNDIYWQNSAVGGSTSTHTKDNWETLVTPHTPSLIIISHGTNDVNMPDNERIANYAFFSQKAKELGAEVLLVTNSTVYFTPSPYGNTPDTNVSRREDIAEMTRNIARKYKWGWCDANFTWNKWIREHGLDETTTLLHYDHIHPNDLGHQLIAYEVLMALTAETPAARGLDDRYGGKGYNLYGKRTFRDLEHLINKRKGYAAFGLNHQLVDWGGIWWTRDYISKFQKAKLHGTQVVTGDEQAQGNYQKFWHIVAREKDYIELEVEDAKRVWTCLHADFSSPVKFDVKVNGATVQTLNVSSSSKTPVEVNFNSVGLKIFRKGRQKVRLQRVDDLPGTGTVTFEGFLVKYYKEGEPEQFTTPSAKSPQQVTQSLTYQTLDVTISNRQEASDIGLTAPLGFASFDDGWVQTIKDQPTMIKWEFYGAVLKLGLKNLLVDNYVSIYIDGVFKETINLKDTSYTTVTKEYAGLGANKLHTVEVISLGGEINLTRVRGSDTVA